MALWLALPLMLTAPAFAEALFKMPEGVESRWSSFENPDGARGAGGKANDGAKGAAFQPIAPGETVTLLHADGPGTVRRMWFTMNRRDPEMLRALRLRCYWDGARTPAVDVPFGDFFGAILGRATIFESALFANPEGRSFVGHVPMPFRDGARITITNESDRRLEQLYYDIAYTLGDAHGEDALYFHAAWRRENLTQLGTDFEVLPRIAGRGRFLGAHIGIIAGPVRTGWWGEGEVKIYLDGDAEWPTIVGTGTEDYIGTAYGQGLFANRYAGSLVLDADSSFFAFYRHHVPDPIYFHEDIRVTLQQMGGAEKAIVQALVAEGAEIIPVSVHNDDGFFPLIDPPRDLDDPDLPGGWTNMYRRDDVSAVALFYLDVPVNRLPLLAPVAERVAGVAPERP